MAHLADAPPAVPPKPFWKRLKRRLRGTVAGRALEWLQYGLFRAGLALLGRAPAGWVDALGGAIGVAARLILARARRTAAANLRAARGALAAATPDPGEVFRHFGAVAVETARLARALDREGPTVVDRWVSGEGVDEIRRALADGRGAILVAPHLGNWELLVLWLARQGLPLVAIGRPIENSLIDGWVRRLRTRTGMTLLDKKGALRNAVHALRAGRLLLVLPDQYAGSTGVPARFFGSPVSAPGLVGALAARLRVPVLVASSRRAGPERYEVRCAALPIPDGAAAEVVTQAAFQALEQEVRRTPGQWLWMHDLWRRTRPRPAAAGRARPDPCAGSDTIPPGAPAEAGAAESTANRKPRSLYRRVKRTLKDTGLWPYAQFLQYCAFRTLIAGVQAIPADALPRVARALASALPTICRRERRAFERNMDLVFGPSFLPAARRRALERVFESFILAAHDTFAFPRRVRRAGLERHFETVGLEHVDAGLARGRGVLFVLGHQGNWELASLHMAWLGYPMTGIFAERTNPRIDDWLTRLRTSTGAEFLLRDGALKRAIRALQANRCLSLVIDLDPGEGGVFVDFFGRPAATLPTAAALARRTGAPIIPFSSERIGPLHYRNTFHPPIHPADAGPEDDRRILQEATAVLERSIRARPEQWAWFGNRWKTRPPAAPTTAETNPCA